jgi:plastocyanin domain-containing protein
MKKVIICLALAVACAPSKSKSSSKTPVAPGADGRIQISVTEKGFEPDRITVKQGQPTTLVFTRKTDETCAKDVVVHVDDQQKIEKALPLNTPVDVAVTFPKAGQLTYACGMDMVTGQIAVQ